MPGGAKKRCAPRLWGDHDPIDIFAGRGGLPTIWQAPMSLRSRLLRFAQPEATLRSLLRNDMQFGKVRSDSLGRSAGSKLV